MIKKLTAIVLLISTSCIANSEESCASMEVVAGNFSNSAFQLTTDDFNAIDKMGFFDAYVMYLSLLYESSGKENRHSREFFLASQVAGVSMKKDRTKIVETLSPEGYAKLFPRLVLRACEAIRSNPHPPE